MSSDRRSATRLPVRGARPNVLLLVADRMRFCDVGYVGNATVRTPNLDRLASEGVVYEHAFSSLPICGPARGTLLTGQYPITHGVLANDVRLPDAAVTLSQTYADHGYRTGFIGKWHLEWLPRKPGYIPPGPSRRGFEFWAAHECSHDYQGGTYFRDTPEPIQVTKYAPVEETDVGIEFLSKASDRPFFLVTAWGIPHMPIPRTQQPEEAYRSVYTNAEIPLRENVPDHGRESAVEYMRHYYGMIAVLDDQIGRLLARLDELGIADDTIVCFCTDHGDMIGSHGVTGLQLPWDECVRVPFVIRWPGRIPSGRRLDTFLNLPDVMPTLLSLCGIDVPPSVEGRDLATCVLARERVDTGSAYLADVLPCHQRYGHEPWRAVRTRRWLYARYPDRPWLLYDLQADPYQLNNLCDSAAHRSVRSKLEDELNAWLARLNDPFLDRMTLKAGLSKTNPRLLESALMTFQRSGKLHPRHLAHPIAAGVARVISFS